MSEQECQDQSLNKYGVRNQDFDNFGNELANQAFDGVDDTSLKAEIIKFGEGLGGWQKTIFMQILKLFFGK